MVTTTSNSPVPVFMGEFDHSMDTKGRLTIPSAWRFGEEVELFIIPSSTAKCLTVMPHGEIERLRAKANSLPGAQRTALLRHIGANGRQVTLDKNGRLTLPDEFCRLLKLAGEVKLSGAVETFEIWNSAEWNTARPNIEVLAGPLLPDFGL